MKCPKCGKQMILILVLAAAMLGPAGDRNTFLFCSRTSRTSRTCSVRSAVLYPKNTDSTLWSTTMDHTNSLLRLPDVQRLTGLSRSSVYRLEATGGFPQRVRLSERATAWREHEILEWCDSRPRVNECSVSAA